MPKTKPSTTKEPFTVSEHKIDPIIVFDRVTKTYNKIHALNNVSLSVQPGEFVSVIGESGAGKSTLAKMIIREEIPTSGTVRVFGDNVVRLSRRRVPYLRRKIGVVFQDFKLLPNKTVYENASFVLEAAGFTKAEIDSFVPKVLDLVGLSSKRFAFPLELSGGEQQRVSIARAIVKSPKILIADEPTGNLDPKNAWDILELLMKINALGTTIMLTTHNKDLVNAVGKRVVTLSGGSLIRDMATGKYVL